MVHSRFRFIDLFSGIGGFRLALESLGGLCVASSEIDLQAREVYRSNWPNDHPDHNLGDLTKLTELPHHELIVGGVPCQPWSIAGHNKGFEDPRGQLWGDVIRIVEHNRPQAFIFENVKGLIDPRHVKYLDIIRSSFQLSGYRVSIKLLNSFDYGVPQNRDRVFIVGIRNDISPVEYVFPPYEENKIRLYQILDNLVLPDQQIPEILIQRDLFGERVGMGFNKLTPKDQPNEFFVLNDIRHGPTSIHSWELWNTTEREKFLCMVILRNRRNKKYGPCDGNPMSYENIKELVPDVDYSELEELVIKKILRTYDDGNFEFVNRRLSGGIDGTYRIFLPTARFFGTLTARGMKDEIAEVSVTGRTEEEYKQNFVTKVLQPRRHRKITVREAARLQAFPDTFRFHRNAPVSMRLLGNSVAVPVVQVVARSLIQTGALVRATELSLAL